MCDKPLRIAKSESGNIRNLREEINDITRRRLAALTSKSSTFAVVTDISEHTQHFGDWD